MRVPVFQRQFAGDRPRYQFPDYNEPWSTMSDEYRMYRGDVGWVTNQYMHGAPIVGTYIRSPHPLTPTQQQQARRTGSAHSTRRHPEVIWWNDPPVKDEHGIPIAPKYSRAEAAQSMVINGRRMRWDGHSWQPRPRTRIITPLWRRWGIPVDTKLQHGPHLPARTRTRDLALRLRENTKPLVSIEIDHPTEQEALDLMDLLRAINS